jgi:hypothetical protein
MRAFLIACAAIVILAVGGYVSVNAMQRLSGAAYTTEGARITPSWSWRRLITRAKALPAGQAGTNVAPTSAGLVDECDVVTTWRWILVDFSNTANEVPDCQ